VLDGLLHPHSSIPYVQMGRSIALCTVSLLSRDGFERAFISQLMLTRRICPGFYASFLQPVTIF